MRIVPIVLLLSCALFAAPNAEVRGTWLTTTANDALATPAHTAETMRRLREIGLNTVYVECWKNGYTEFPSATLEKTIKISHKINLPPSTSSGQAAVPAASRDLLGETIVEAHRNQLLHFAWFEYGFMAASKDTANELRRTRPQWLLRDKDGGEVAPDGMVWMNPLHPEVRAFLLGIIVEALNRYDVDGVQLDDRLAWPANTMGYDDYTSAAYAKDHGGPPPKEPDNAEWVRWRTEKVTEFAEDFYEAVRKARPDVLVSVSPSPYPFSAEQHAADWPAWARSGWMDEFVPQMYRDSAAQFAKEWPRQVDAVGTRRGDLVAGLRIVGEGRDTPWSELEKMCDLVRQSGCGGHCWWFSRGVLNVYPEEIRRYYFVAARGYAAHPKRDENWRPPPIVGTKRGEHWSLRVEKPAIYQIITKKKDGVWTPLRIQHAQRGIIDLHDQGYESVELLLDRRARR